MSEKEIQWMNKYTIYMEKKNKCHTLYEKPLKYEYNYEQKYLWELEIYEICEKMRKIRYSSITHDVLIQYLDRIIDIKKDYYDFCKSVYMEKLK